jgi:hypothetical protein
MAIKNFKKIEERKGYLVEDSDRQIFEKEIGKSYFGRGLADMFEFVLYDSNDNLLPQGENGRLVRYLNINDDETKKYFLVSQSEFTKKANNASEMLFDLEQLIRDAGYNAGIFKTQITLLNRRVGKDEIDNDKLWIHEISPSRTEIRILPVKNNNPSQDLLTRYEVFTKEGEFRDDTIYFIDEYIRSIDVERVFQKFLTSKGGFASGEQYISLIKKEFKIDSVELLINRVKEKFVEAMKHFGDGREYRITSNNYGQPKQTFDTIELSVEYIKRTASEILVEIINYYLPKRNILEKDVLTKDQQVTFDKVKQILKTVGSNDKFDSSIPNEVNAQVRGCTDPDAKNFNPAAEIDNGTCQYEQEEIPPQIIRGCTDIKALNYDEFATEDDGNCEYEEVVDEKDNTPKPKTITKTWYVWSSTADIKYKNDDGFNYSSWVEYDSFTISYYENSFRVASPGDVREVPKQPKPQIITREYYVENITHSLPQRDDYNANGRDSYSNDPRDLGQPLTFSYRNELGVLKESPYVEPSSSITICAQRGSVQQQKGLKIVELGNCGENNPTPTPIPSNPIPSSGGTGSGGGRPSGGETEQGNFRGGTSGGRRNDGSFRDERIDRIDRNML